MNLVYLTMLDTLLNIFLLVSILVALFLGIGALRLSKNMHNAVKYLAWFIIYVALSNFQSWIVLSNPKHLYPEIAMFFVSFELLPAPFFLMFLSNFLRERTFSLKHRVLLFMPFWLFTAIYIYIKADILINDRSFEMAKVMYFPFLKIEEVVTLVYVIVVVFTCFARIRTYETEHGHLQYAEITSRTSWLKKVLILGIALAVLWVITLIFDLISIYRFGNYAYLPAWFGYLFLVIYIGYSGFTKSGVLKERETISNAYKNTAIDSKFSSSESKKDSTFKYFERVEVLMTKEKFHLNPHFNLNALAETISISPNYLSKIINTHAKVNFSDYVNAYRIDFAKEMLENKEFENYKMLSIALEAGFNSKSSFYTAFSKLTGQTPGHYKTDFHNDKES